MLDDRIRTLTGHTGRQLQRHYDDGLLPADLAALAEAHRRLLGNQTSVVYHLGRLHQLSDGRVPADAALLERLERAMRHLAEAVVQRNGSLAGATAVLERLEKAARSRDEGDVPDLSAADFARLLALVRGAKLQQNLVSHRLSVVTASGTRLPAPALQRLESAGLVEVDRAHPLHAGQPVALTALGRRTLTGRAPAPVDPPPTRSPLPAAPHR